MSDADFLLFDSSITRRGRAWRWCVSSEAGEIVLQGIERSRPAAQYRAACATFSLLLTAPYWRRTSSAELSDWLEIAALKFSSRKDLASRGAKPSAGLHSSCPWRTNLVGFATTTSVRNQRLSATVAAT